MHDDTFHLGQVHSTAGVLPMSEFRPKYRDRLSFSSLSASTDAKLIEAGLAVTNLSSSLTDLRPGLKQESEKSQTTLSVGRQRPGERGERGEGGGDQISSLYLSYLDSNNSQVTSYLVDCTTTSV